MESTKKPDVEKFGEKKIDDKIGVLTITTSSENNPKVGTYVNKIIKKYNRNRTGFLSPNETQVMLQHYTGIEVSLNDIIDFLKSNNDSSNIAVHRSQYLLHLNRLMTLPSCTLVVLNEMVLNPDSMDIASIILMVKPCVASSGAKKKLLYFNTRCYYISIIILLLISPS